ncbi:MAG: hypothetical protein ABEJ98_05195 [Candidatus Nanohaloarchaea archaeon]
MNREKRERLSKELENQRKKVDTALQNYNGNPDTKKALEALNSRIDAVSEALNLNI